MPKKKYYAVRSECINEIYESWDACKAAVTGVKGVKYKSFTDYDEALRFLSGEESRQAQILPEKGSVIAYVDGSYEDSIKKYAFGCVLITQDAGIVRYSGNGDNPASLAIRNVAGEMIGAMFAVKWAALKSYQEIEIRYDYEGIEKWVSGAWKAKMELTAKYAAYMRNMSKKIKIKFCKVTAHSNNQYNDEADALAKDALVNGNGIPEI